jgi:hypothetical protein
MVQEKTIRLTFLLLITPILMLGCVNPGKATSEEEQTEVDRLQPITNAIDLQFDSTLASNIRYVASTIDYFAYGLPENFWYPEETSLQDMFDDEFRYALKNLKTLEHMAGNITSLRPFVAATRDTLLMEIKNCRTKLRKLQKAIELADNMGMGLFGGIGALLSVTELLSGDNEEDHSMPSELATAMVKLQDAIGSSYMETAVAIHAFELRTTQSYSLSLEEKRKIRDYIDEKFRQGVIGSYEGGSNSVLISIITGIMNRYENMFPLD